MPKIAPPKRVLLGLAVVLPVAAALAGVWVLVRTRPAAGPARSATGRSDAPASDIAVYVPQEADFRTSYDADATNKGRQEWPTHWGWVKSFYEGNMLVEGWIKYSEGTVSRVRDPARRGQVRAKFNALGRQIAAEWAKDSKTRKISSDDLKRWFERLRGVTPDRDPESVELETVLDGVRDEIDKRMAVPPNRNG